MKNPKWLQDAIDRCSHRNCGSYCSAAVKAIKKHGAVDYARTQGKEVLP